MRREKNTVIYVLPTASPGFVVNRSLETTAFFFVCARLAASRFDAVKGFLEVQAEGTHMAAWSSVFLTTMIWRDAFWGLFF